MIILVIFSKILLKCKNVKQANKPSLKTNVDLTAKLSKATLKYIACFLTGRKLITIHNILIYLSCIKIAYNNNKKHNLFGNL